MHLVKENCVAMEEILIKIAANFLNLQPAAPSKFTADIFGLAPRLEKTTVKGVDRAKLGVMADIM